MEVDNTSITVSDNVVVGMYFTLPHGDMSFVLLEAIEGHIGLELNVPAVMSDSIAKSIRSWLRGIKTDASPVFAGRSVPMVTIKADLPETQVAHVTEILVRIAGTAMQDG